MEAIRSRCHEERAFDELIVWPRFWKGLVILGGDGWGSNSHGLMCRREIWKTSSMKHKVLTLDYDSLAGHRLRGKAARSLRVSLQNEILRRDVNNACPLRCGAAFQRMREFPN
jgi:hypothetical protein